MDMPAPVVTAIRGLRAASESAAPPLTAALVARFAAGGAFLGLAGLIGREAVTWVAGEPLPERALAWFMAAGAALAVAAALLAWHRIPPRWPVPVTAALLAAWPAYTGFTQFVSDAVVPDGQPVRAVVMANLSIAALVLAFRQGQPSLNWAAVVLAAAGLSFAAVSLYDWRNACGPEAGYGGCEQTGRLEQERLFASIDVPARARWIEVGPGFDGVPEGLLAVPVADARATAFDVPEGVAPGAPSDAVDTAESRRGRRALAVWTAPAPRGEVRGCNAILSAVVDPDRAEPQLSLRVRAEVSKPGAAVLRLVAWCE